MDALTCCEIFSVLFNLTVEMKISFVPFVDCRHYTIRFIHGMQQRWKLPLQLKSIFFWSKHNGTWPLHLWTRQLNNNAMQYHIYLRSRHCNHHYIFHCCMLDSHESSLEICLHFNYPKTRLTLDPESSTQIANVLNNSSTMFKLFHNF